MKNHWIAYILMASFAISSCDILDDSPCGVTDFFDIYLLGSSIVDTSTGVYYSFLDGTTRVFQWSQIVEGVCPEEHVKIDARVALLDETTTGLSAQAGASWLFLFERRFNLTKSGADLKGTGEAGLKQAFDKDPGWLVPFLEVKFPTKGSYAADTSFLKTNVISIELMAKYRRL